jgi:hypothetical protein
VSGAEAKLVLLVDFLNAILSGEFEKPIVEVDEN